MKYQQQITHSKIFDFNKKKTFKWAGWEPRKMQIKILSVFFFVLYRHRNFVCSIQLLEYAIVRYETNISIGERVWKAEKKHFRQQ